MATSKFKLVVTDIDNTVFDWVNYYVSAFSAMLSHVSSVVGVSWETLAEESKTVFTANGSIEYPFLVQELKSVNEFYGYDVDKMLAELVRPSRDIFLKAAEPHLIPYPGVCDTLAAIQRDYPNLPIIALTDAPRYVAMWKLNKLKLLPYFSAVYGLADPRIPTCDVNRRVKVDPDILLKHLQRADFGFPGKIRILPDDYEKPGIRGLKTVLMDYDLDEHKEARSAALWVGDNLRKDIGLGSALGVTTAWAEYGTRIAPESLQKLAAFSPIQNIHKNVYIKSDSPDAPKPQRQLGAFGDLLSMFA